MSTVCSSRIRRPFSRNEVSQDESKFLGTTEYEPSKIPDDAKQNIFLHYGLGITNPKKIPPYHDDAMQSRVARIGNSLIPEFQRNLPQNDRRKIHFQFQVVNGLKLKDALALPSGIIVVPHQVVESLPNDSQLAAVLADNIATIVEKQAYRIKPATTTLAAIKWTSVVGGFFVPGLGLGSDAVGIANH